MLAASCLKRQSTLPNIFSRVIVGRSLSTAASYPYPAKVREPKMFEKILVANRGEIACRVMKTAKKMGIKTVAIYSDADANAMHVAMADEAYRVGPPPTSQSYLVVDNILEAVKNTGAEAVHPGYGFLSENAGFVKTLEERGVTFIGPNTNAMAMMGDKIQSKIIAKNANVSTIPGFNGICENAEHAMRIAREIGYPVMVKASAGGGGKGMRIAYTDEEVKDAFRLSAAEAKSSFGDDRLLVEKFIEDPRHIEIQIIGDQHGNVYYLPERECSIQRRNQKVIEEAPSVHINPETRRAMGEQAISLAKQVGYYSAGTCEFLVDPKRNFYFLEMNTRLQVEHPITEYITGLDLVECMIRVAAGEKLPLIQEETAKPKGWAFESRVYAEDPEKYLPSIGRLSKYMEPKGGSEIRCDSGVREGSEISMYYDPMICKLCTYGETREEARLRMSDALDNYVIKGVTHNIPLLHDVINHPRFAEGRLSTKFLAEEYPGGFKGHQLSEVDSLHLESVAAYIFARRDVRNRTWISGGGSIGDHTPKPTEWDLWIDTNTGAEPKNVLVKDIGGGQFSVTVGEQTNIVSADWPLETPLVKANIGDVKQTIQFLESNPLGFVLQFHGTKYNVKAETKQQKELSEHMLEKPKIDLTSVVLSPMPGTLVSVSVKDGQTVAEGQEVAIVEAMKMQNVLRAPRVGKIKKVYVSQGASVAADEAVLSHVQQPGKPPKVAAIITTFDILTYIVSTAKDSKSFDPNAIDLNASIDLVMSLDDSVETYRIWECDYRDTLERTMAAFAKQTHRALITDALEKNAPYILGQTDIIKFANNHRELLTSIVDINRPIKDLGLVHPDKKLIAMSETDTAFDGYKIMSKTNVPALPILNSNGSIVGNLSSSDLRGITPEKLTNLTLPVLDYLKLGLHDVSQWCERITQLETELKEKESRLEFVEKERYQRNVLAISHEIRTQLNGIIGPCSLLCDTELTEHQGELVSSIAECSDNLNQIVNDILDFSKLSSEGFSLDNRPFCLKRTVESVMLSYQVRASKKNLQLSFHFEKNSPTFILGDIGRLKQVFHNLLGNAVKFTNQGSISLSVASKSLGNNKYEIEVKISDTGIGMKQEDMNEIFEPFKQGDTPQKNNGTGLGLAISKAIIEQMGGKIWCESRFGVGTNFIFTFITEECYGACCGRTHVPNFASHQSKKSRLNFYTPNSFTNITLDPEDRNFPLNILIADDNEINVMVSLKVLEKLGFKADVATNGLEAVKAVKNKSYDLILMDIKMPEMDGFTASRTIRNDSSVKVQPIIIALTANTFQTDSEKCVEAGMNGKIVKPLVNNELVATIRSVINGVRARGSGRADSPCSTIQSFSS
ncbi:hypothetical protein HK098_007953 [Nowakowskiella sp. JEL0407]|nr:hypothetical protein HK098_007953 [Nowakowskiella sp. JEL0407]